MVRRSAVEKSEHRDEIDDLLLDGNSPRFVSTFLKDKYSESISHTAINNYKKKYLDIEKQTRIKYHEKKSKKKVEKQVKKGLNDLDALDDIIYDKCNITSNLDKVEDPTEKEKLKIQLKNTRVRAVQAKHNILKDDETNIEVHYNGLTGLADAIRKSKEENSREQKNI